MQTVSIQIPDNAEPGDVLNFTVDGNDLELEIPDGSKPGDVLELQLATGGAGEQEEYNAAKEDDATSTSIQLVNGKSLVLYHLLPSGQGENDGTHRMMWPSGKCVAEQGFPAVSPSSNDSILELGSGLGVMGLAYAASARLDDPTSIVLTDCAAAMPLLEYNVSQNKHVLPANVEVKSRPLQWSETAGISNETFSLILGSDLLYNIQSIPALVATIQQYIRPAGQIILTVRWRKPDLERDFFTQTEAMGITWNLHTVSSNIGSCQLDWRQFGDPTKEESNLYFTQTMVAIQGKPKSIGAISERDLEAMTDAEHEIFESKYVQTYLGVMK